MALALPGAIAFLSLAASVPAYTHSPSSHAGLFTVCESTPTREQTRAFLARLGVSSETACAAGVTAAEVVALFEAGADTADTLAASIQSANEGVSSARSTLAQTRRLVSSCGDGSMDSALADAETALQSALVSQVQVYEVAFAAVTASLPETTRALLANLRAHAGRKTPVEFHVASRTPEQWEALEKALVHIRARQQSGLQATAERQAVVTSASSEPAVYAAKQRLETSLAAVRAAWMATPQS